MTSRIKAPILSAAACAALALSLTTAQAFDVLHVGNADSADYSAFIIGKSGTWTHVASGLTTAGTVGGDLDRVTDFPVNGTHGGTGITVRSYLESFDLIIIGNGVTSTNFVDGAGGADWAAIAKPILFHPSLVARALGGRPGMFSGDNNITFTYGNPDDTARVSTSELGDAIFKDVTSETDLYNGISTETVNAIATFGGGELISSLTDGATNHHGIVFWNAGSTNAVGLTMAAKRAFLPIRNAANSSTTLTADGKKVLGNLIDQLLVPTAPVFLPPSGVTAKSGVASINLTWTASSGAVSYNIKRSETAGGPYTTVSTAGTVTGTSYSDGGLTNGTTYYYVISAVNSSAAESANSSEASAVPVPVVQPGIDILYVSNSNSVTYEAFATNGQFSNNTWTQKPTGTGTADNQIGGDLDRTTNFTGIHGGNDITVRDYMEQFDLIIIGVPTTSGNFVDGADGAAWAAITKPILFHAAVVARGLDGRPGLFAGNNFITFTHGDPADTARESNSALSDAILNGVSDVTNLYTLSQSDTISSVVPVPNAFGNGEQITSLTDGTVSHRGVVFWPAGATIPVQPDGLVLSANRAYLPLKGGIGDLTADGLVITANLINQLQVAQTVPPALLTIPTELAAIETAGQVLLSWSPSIGATSYTVKRSTTAGTGYVPIHTGAATTFTDTTVVAGATYFYVVTASSAAPAESANSNEATVTLPGGGGFPSWIDGFTTQLPDAADRDPAADPAADPDKDGSSNLIEFALNGNPADPSNNGAIASLIHDSSLKLVIAVRDGAVFNAGSASIDGISYAVEGSLDLAFPGSAVSSTGPSDTAPPATGLPDLTGTAWEYHIFTLDASANLPGKGFLRLKVSQP
jgi:hypothetical protein